MFQSLNARKLALAQSLLDLDDQTLPLALDAMTSLLGADVGLLSIGRPGQQPRVRLSTCRERPGVPGRALPDLERELGPLCDTALMHSAGRLYVTRELASETSLAASDYLSEWLRSTPFSDGCVGYLHGSDGEICRLGFGIVGDGTRAPLFDQGNLGALAALLPHLESRLQALGRSRLLEALCASFLNRYNHYHIGVIVMDLNGFVLFRNDTANVVIGQQRGLGLRGNRLGLSGPVDVLDFMAEVREHATSGRPDGTFAQRLFPVGDPGPTGLTLAISRWGPADVPGNALCTVLVFDPSRPRLDRREAVRLLYNLSDREADLLAAVAEGESLECFAERARCSEVAARSALKRIFRKTGTTRQAEVVKLLLSGPAAMVS